MSTPAGTELRSPLEIHRLPGCLNANFGGDGVVKEMQRAGTSDVASVVVKQASASWKPACCREGGGSVMYDILLFSDIQQHNRLYASFTHHIPCKPLKCTLG